MKKISLLFFIVFLIHPFETKGIILTSGFVIETDPAVINAYRESKKAYFKFAEQHRGEATLTKAAKARLLQLRQEYLNNANLIDPRFRLVVTLPLEELMWSQEDGYQIYVEGGEYRLATPGSPISASSNPVSLNLGSLDSNLMGKLRGENPAGNLQQVGERMSRFAGAQKEIDQKVTESWMDESVRRSARLVPEAYVQAELRRRLYSQIIENNFDAEKVFQSTNINREVAKIAQQDKSLRQSDAFKRAQDDISLPQNIPSSLRSVLEAELISRLRHASTAEEATEVGSTFQKDLDTHLLAARTNVDKMTSALGTTWSGLSEEQKQAESKKFYERALAHEGFFTDRSVAASLDVATDKTSIQGKGQALLALRQKVNKIAERNFVSDTKLGQFSNQNIAVKYKATKAKLFNRLQKWEEKVRSGEITQEQFNELVNSERGFSPLDVPALSETTPTVFENKFLKKGATLSKNVAENRTALLKLAEEAGIGLTDPEKALPIAQLLSKIQEKKAKDKSNIELARGLMGKLKVKFEDDPEAKAAKEEFVEQLQKYDSKANIDMPVNDLIDLLGKFTTAEVVRPGDAPNPEVEKKKKAARAMEVYRQRLEKADQKYKAERRTTRDQLNTALRELGYEATSLDSVTEANLDTISTNLNETLEGERYRDIAEGLKGFQKDTEIEEARLALHKVKGKRKIEDVRRSLLAGYGGLTGDERNEYGYTESLFGDDVSIIDNFLGDIDTLPTDFSDGSAQAIEAFQGKRGELSAYAQALKIQAQEVRDQLGALPKDATPEQRQNLERKAAILENRASTFDRLAANLMNEEVAVDATSVAQVEKERKDEEKELAKDKKTNEQLAKAVILPEGTRQKKMEALLAEAEKDIEKPQAKDAADWTYLCQKLEEEKAPKGWFNPEAVKAVVGFSGAVAFGIAQKRLYEEGSDDTTFHQMRALALIGSTILQGQPMDPAAPFKRKPIDGAIMPTDQMGQTLMMGGNPFAQSGFGSQTLTPDQRLALATQARSMGFDITNPDVQRMLGL